MDYNDTWSELVNLFGEPAAELIDMGVTVGYAIDPLYLVLLLGLLIWVQLGRIAYALAGGERAPKGVTHRINQVDERLESLSQDMKSLQVESQRTQNVLRGKPLSSERALAVYRHQTA